FTHGMLDPWFKRRYPLKHLKKWLYWPWAEYRVLRDARAVLFTCEDERRLASRSFWLYRAHERVVGYGIAPPGGGPEAERQGFPREVSRTGGAPTRALSRTHAPQEGRRPPHRRLRRSRLARPVARPGHGRAGRPGLDGGASPEGRGARTGKTCGVDRHVVAGA